MFGVSLPELAIIFIVVLVVFGPDKLPEIARLLGRVSGELRKHSNSFRREFYNAVYTPVEDLRTRINTGVDQLTSSAPTTPAASASETAAAPPSAVAPDPASPTAPNQPYVEEKKP